MTRVAFLTAGCMLPGHPELRTDHYELDLEFAPMRAGCARRGIELELAVWDAPDLDVERYDALVIGTTWDYAPAPQRFLAALERFEAARPLFNPVRVVRWNLDKRYLVRLAERGARTVPTRYVERVDPQEVEAAFDAFGTEELVAKPLVGASAWRQARLVRGAPLPPAELLPPAAALIQPFLPAVVEEGELSLVLFGGRFSHAARKRPAPGDYRVQSMYGAREEVAEPEEDELEAARRALAAVGEDLLYARVDLVRGLDGRPCVMELELVEPYLYPEQGPGLGECFADALVARLG